MRELARRVFGVTLLVASVVAAVLFVLGSWNPWRLVVLEYRFGNPALGALVVPAGALVGLWLGLPVRNEARQRGRIAARLVAAALILVGVFAWGLFGSHFRFDVAELARSGDGTRTVVLVTDQDTPRNSYLRIWRGSGLAGREVGEVGRVCGVGISARFLTAHRIEVRSSYGTWPIDLDPVTGTPRQVLGPRCPDGPIPATLGG
jgi:hypothetical protein